MRRHSSTLCFGIILIILIIIAVIWFHVIPGSQWLQSVNGQSCTTNGDTDLVVATCREDLTWVLKVARRFRRVYIYTKCGGCEGLPSTHTNIRIVALPNIGSCDYVYLTHIIEEYHTLPTAIEFHVGSGDRKSLRFSYALLRLVLWRFRLMDYSFRNHAHLPFHKSAYNDLWHYTSAVLGPQLASRLRQRARYVYYGGVFMATRDEIQQHPRVVYERLRQTQHYANEEVDHFIERLWGPLFTCSQQ